MGNGNFHVLRTTKHAKGAVKNQAFKDIIYTNQGNKERTATDNTKHVHTRATRPSDEKDTF